MSAHPPDGAATGDGRRWGPKVQASPPDGLAYHAGAVDPGGPTAPRHAGATIWITGLPAAGKTTLARALDRELSAAGHRIALLDGDDLRRDACRDLGFDRASRAEMAKRAARLASSGASDETIVIVALVSPYAADRRGARELHAECRLPFIEVFLDTPPAVCRRRDPKGLYARAARGQLSGLTGVDDPYEQPDHPELRLPVQALELSVRAVLDALAACGVIRGQGAPSGARERAVGDHVRQHP